MGATMSSVLGDRNFLGTRTEHVPVRERLAEAFRLATRGLKAPAKTVARATGKTPEMAEKWLRGENAPSAEALIAAMRDFDEVWEAVREMAGRASNASEAEAVLAKISAALKERGI